MTLSNPIHGQDEIEFVDWESWMAIAPPGPDRPVRQEEVVLRFAANGFDWDIHGTLVTPLADARAEKFVLTHGGAGSEAELLETPDGRAGLALVLARQGFETLAVSYVGHYPQGGVWAESPAERQPDYLFGTRLSAAEIGRRNLVCSFDVTMKGMGMLVDRLFDGADIVAFGHSTGGPMAVALQEYLRYNRVVGIVGWGSSPPAIWGREFDQWFTPRPRPWLPLDSFARRTPDWFRAAGYEDPEDLAPWGGAEGYARWADRRKSQFKTGLCEIQLFGTVAQLRAYAAATGLPEGRFLDYLHEPDPAWLRRTGVLLMAGERDSRLIGSGPATGMTRHRFLTQKFAVRARRTVSRIVARYGHFGFVGLHNERIAHSWIAALEAGLFRPDAAPEAARDPAPAP